MDAIYRYRGWFASAPSVVILSLAIFLSSSNLPKPAKKPIESPIKVTLAPPIINEPLPLPAPPPPPAQPQPIVKPRPIVSQQKPKLVTTPTLAQTPVVADLPVPTVVVPATEPTPAFAAPPSPPDLPSHASNEDAYTAKIRADIETGKHYPTSKEARLQKPRGEAEIWFVIKRDGSLEEAGVDVSSGSLILDSAALSLVRGRSYPAFPAGTFNTEASHRFMVHLNYTLT